MDVYTVEFGVSVEANDPIEAADKAIERYNKMVVEGQGAGAALTVLNLRTCETYGVNTIDRTLRLPKNPGEIPEDSIYVIPIIDGRDAHPAMATLLSGDWRYLENSDERGGDYWRYTDKLDEEAYWKHISESYEGGAEVGERKKGKTRKTRKTAC